MSEDKITNSRKFIIYHIFDTLLIKYLNFFEPVLKFFFNSSYLQ